MASVATYEVIYILSGGGQKRLSQKGAPRLEALYNRRPKDSLFVIRYFPSRRAWRVYRLSHFLPATLYTGKDVIRVPPAEIETSDCDAAIMAAVLLC